MVAYNDEKDFDNDTDEELFLGMNDDKNIDIESGTKLKDYITTKPKSDNDLKTKTDTIEMVNNEEPITLSSILNKHSNINDIDSRSPEIPTTDKLSSLLKTSSETQPLPYTKYILGGGFFILFCIVLYNLYFYISENKIFSKINNYFNPTPVKKTNEKKQEEPKKTNYKKEGFENNINGLDKAINGKVNKNSLNSDVKFFSSDSDITSDNKVSDDDSSSYTQIGMTKDKHCYIGTDRGFRCCIEIGEADKCMSGDIFPTHDMCINPSLRQ